MMHLGLSREIPWHFLLFSRYLKRWHNSLWCKGSNFKVTVTEAISKEYLLRVVLSLRPLVLGSAKWCCRKNMHLLEVSRALFYMRWMFESVICLSLFRLVDYYYINSMPLYVLKGKCPIKLLLPDAPFFSVSTKTFCCSWSNIKIN